MENLKKDELYDVVVVGGGAAGCIAAIQAARAGAKTTLIEKNSILGGTTVVASVNFPGLFHAWGRQIIAGIGWEAIEKTVERENSKLPDFTKPTGRRHWKHQILVNKFVYSTILDELCEEENIRVRFHEMPVEIITTENEQGHHKLVVAGKTGLTSIGFKKIVDATGDANVAGLMGFSREKGGTLQPGTLAYSLGGYELEKVDRQVLKDKYDVALNEGRILKSDHGPAEVPFYNELRIKGKVTSMHVPGIDGSTSKSRSEADIKARQTLMRIYTFLRSIPGCENIYVDFFANECGIRETWRIKGEKTVDLESYVSGKIWDDAICYSFYPIDVHHHDSNTIDVRPLSEGIVPTIPYGALVPLNSDHLLVAGRCIAGDQEANSAYRVQASCMATGQAAGAAAATAALTGLSVREVNLDDVRRVLQQHKAIVPLCE